MSARLFQFCKPTELEILLYFANLEKSNCSIWHAPWAGDNIDFYFGKHKRNKSRIVFPSQYAGQLGNTKFDSYFAKIEL